MHDKTVESAFEERCEHCGRHEADGHPEEKEVHRGNNHTEKLLPQPVCYPRFRQVVLRHFQPHAVADGQPHKVFSHFAGKVRQDFVLIVQLHAKHRSRQNGRNCPLQFDMVFTHPGKFLFEEIKKMGGTLFPEFRPVGIPDQ